MSFFPVGTLQIFENFNTDFELWYRLFSKFPHFYEMILSLNSTPGVSVKEYPKISATKSVVFGPYVFDVKAAYE